MNEIQGAIDQIGHRALTESLVVKYVHPLFSNVLKNFGDKIYLANHSLGRPLNQTVIDVQLATEIWYQKLDDAWDDWLSRMHEFRQQIAELIHAPNADCIVPKNSAGQGLRTILNCFDEKLDVVTTQDEFTSVDFILKNYYQRGRINLKRMSPDEDRCYCIPVIRESLQQSGQLLVISLVMFTTGQLLTELQELIAEVHKHDGKVLVDLYHAAGTVPVDITQLDADYAIGGCYKYLRGGPGACWLYIHPRYLDGSLRTLDSGWFAQQDPFRFLRPDVPSFAKGGSAFFESTPAVLPFYQAKAGIEFVLGLGVSRLREYSLHQQELLCGFLSHYDTQIRGSPDKRGAFITIPHVEAEIIAAELIKKGVHTDAREGLLRVCPDVLNTETELRIASERLASTIKGH